MLRERKGGLIESDVPRYYDPVCGKVETMVATMIGRIPEEYIRLGAGCKLVCSCGGEIGIAPTTEDTKSRVVGR